MLNSYGFSVEARDVYVRMFYVVSYRKVATDKCQGGPLEAKYRPRTVNCSVIKPAGLSIEVTGGDVITVNREVTFNLSQEQVIMSAYVHSTLL